MSISFHDVTGTNKMLRWGSKGTGPIGPSLYRGPQLQAGHVLSPHLLYLLLTNLRQGYERGNRPICFLASSTSRRPHNVISSLILPLFASLGTLVYPTHHPFLRGIVRRPLHWRAFLIAHSTLALHFVCDNRHFSLSLLRSSSLHVGFMHLQKEKSILTH